MTDRRQFLGFGLAASAWPVVGAAFARPFGEHAACPIYKAVCDRRAPGARAFAGPLAAHGVPVHATDGDVTRLWYDDLALRWRESPVAIAGLTAADTLFCLEQLAWDHRMRVVFRAERIADGQGRVVQRIEGPEHALGSLPRGTRSSLRAAADPASLGRAAREAPLAASRPGGRARLTLPEPAGVATDPWIAWVIAPVHRGRPIV